MYSTLPSPLPYRAVISDCPPSVRATSPVNQWQIYARLEATIFDRPDVAYADARRATLIAFRAVAGETGVNQGTARQWQGAVGEAERVQGQRVEPGVEADTGLAIWQVATVVGREVA